ncbi:MAG: hypothetical protein ACXVH7_13175, partial [Thermoanaerobaculia bacterium]
MSFRRIVLHATAVVFLVFHLTADTHRVPQLTATMSGGAVRYAGFGEVREIRLEVFDDRGRLVFDPPFTSGNVIDYPLTDSSGALLKDGAYAFVVTVHDFDGAPTGKFGTFTISASRVALDNASVDRLSPDQQIAISRGRTLLPIDRIAMEMPMQVQPPQIVIAPSPAMPAQNVQPRSDVAGTGTPNVVTK